MISRSRPRVAGTRGAANAPPRPARNAPRGKADVNSQAWFTPSAASMLRCSAAARSNRPQRQQVGLWVAPATDLHGAGQPGGARSKQVFGAPDRQRGVADDEHQGERGQQLEQFGCLVQPLEHQPFRGRPDQAGSQRGQQQAGPIAGAVAEIRGERPGQVDAQHVERTVREIHHTGHAENQRQARGNQEQRAGVRQAIKQLRQQPGQAHQCAGRILRTCSSGGCKRAPSM
ncbi:hypothetical protein G6F50_014316 [Rhizopus delemar]|uniref:Uncharacterized protein n=1 Tax=Rhizopus delemar TaxID=936053 RepID=A0A9P6Y796_9FUNG|nr:hypothetical protein G6F50_014316 [Rhizopus delemar]